MKLLPANLTATGEAHCIYQEYKQHEGPKGYSFVFDTFEHGIPRKICSATEQLSKPGLQPRYRLQEKEEQECLGTSD